MKEDMMHIAFGFDQNYAMPCGVAILSVCRNTPRPLYFHALVAEDVTQETKKQIEEMALSYGNRMAWYQVDSAILKKLPEHRWYGKSIYNRLLIPDLLPEDVTKVLYLDSDILALKSLRPVWEMVLADDEPAAMAFDSGCSDIYFHNRVDIPLSQPYFNSGVILMNLTCWRKEGIRMKCMEKIGQNNYTLVDQDAINAVIGARVRNLHLRYNLQVSILKCPEDDLQMDKERCSAQVHEAIEDPVIIHYTDCIKPWHEGCPDAKEWLDVKNGSPWKDTPLVSGKKLYTLHLDLVKEINMDDAITIASPLFALILDFSRKHHKVFSRLSKLVWKIAEKHDLLAEKTGQ